jgi:ferric-dicitrate binding protein FerR (iron transport regulator)
VGDAYDRAEQDGAGDIRIAQLLKLAGRRPMPEAAQMARARAAARAEWISVTNARRWRAWRLTLAAAAAALTVSLGAWLLIQRPAAPVAGVEVAMVERLVGAAAAIDEAGVRRGLDPGAALRAGDRIEVGDRDSAALALPDGLSLRLDSRTIATLEPGAVRLAAGAIYIDSGSNRAAAPVVVRTSLGTVRHVGTQFEVRLQKDSLRVNVREGTVVLEQGNDRWIAHAGSALLAAPGRPPERSTAPASGPGWEWVAALARPFQLEGATLAAFLDWAAREEGLRWAFADEALARRVGGTVLHGSIDGLTPQEALAAVLPTCGLTSHRDGERLIVSAAR